MIDIFEVLKEQAFAKTRHLPDEAFTIRGLWKVDLAFRPNPDERTFRYNFLVAQTMGQGSCYCDKELEINEGLLGRDAREIISEMSCYEIAILDSIYASIPRSPAAVHELRGNSVEKAVARGAIIVDEVERLLGKMGAVPEKTTVVNVGVVGNLIKALREKRYNVVATDLDSKIIGTPIHGVTVQDGAKTYQAVGDADVAVITGMTLTTDALNDIVHVCQSNQTRLVMFAETGANFGDEYCRTIGVDVVVSEPFPFYIFQGVTTIEIYRR
jgi:Putative heavy-metal chelation